MGNQPVCLLAPLPVKAGGKATSCGHTTSWEEIEVSRAGLVVHHDEESMSPGLSQRSESHGEDRECIHNFDELLQQVAADLDLFTSLEEDMDTCRFDELPGEAISSKNRTLTICNPNFSRAPITRSNTCEKSSLSSSSRQRPAEMVHSMRSSTTPRRSTFPTRVPRLELCSVQRLTGLTGTEKGKVAQLHASSPTQVPTKAPSCVAVLFPSGLMFTCGDHSNILSCRVTSNIYRPHVEEHIPGSASNIASFSAL